MHMRIGLRGGSLGGAAIPIALVICLLAASVASQRAAAGPALVFDPETGAVLYSEKPDQLWHPASLTKLMTAYLTFEALKQGKFTLKSKITCSPEARKQPPSKLGLPVGATLTVDKGLRALIVKSSNDVAVMLGEKVAGSHQAFVRKMNETAKRLGMRRTRFQNANGLPDSRMVTTARDMALLTRALMRDFPERDGLFALKTVRHGKRNLRSHNGLLRSFTGADGMKTGYICASGYNIVASATRGGRRVVAVVLGGVTGGRRNARARELLQYGFDHYWWKSAFSTKLDDLEMEAGLTGVPRNICNYVQQARRGVRKKRRKYRRRASRR